MTRARSLTVLFAVALVTMGASFFSGRRSLGAQSARPVILVRLYTGSDGQTHFEERPIGLKANRSLSELSDPQKSPGVQFWRALPGFSNDWHPAPAGQYNIRLTGRLEVELSDGKKIRLDPGRIVLAEDVTGKGHITRCLGPEDCVSVLIPLDADGSKR